MNQSTVNMALAELLEALKNYNAALKNAGQMESELVKTFLLNLEAQTQ